MLPSDIRSMQEAYRNVYEQSDFLTDDLIEEIVEELVQECVEFGYDLNESADAVEEAAILYIDEATVTYGSDTESPEQRSARAKDRLGDRKASARKAAVKGAVERVKSTIGGVKAAAGIAGSIAKDEVRRAGRTASHAVTHAIQKKKAEVKQGIKGLIGKGLRKAAGAAGAVAQKARKAGAAAGRAAERLGEEKDDSYLETNMKNREKNNNAAIKSMKNTSGYRSMAATATKKLEEKVEQIDEIDSSIIARTAHKRMQNLSAAQKRENSARDAGASMGERSRVGAEVSDAAAKVSRHRALSTAHARSRARMGANEEVEIYDVVLEYLMTEGHADTIAEAEYIMTELDSEMVNQILETRLDPRGRPASGPMNVYANPKGKPDQAHLDAIKSYDAKQRAKTPEQRQAELDAYIARQRNK